MPFVGAYELRRVIERGLEVEEFRHGLRGAQANHTDVSDRLPRAGQGHEKNRGNRDGSPQDRRG